MKHVILFVIFIFNVLTAETFSDKTFQVFSAMEKRSFEMVSAQMHADDVKFFREKFSMMIDSETDLHKSVFGKKYLKMNFKR